ncbi:MAG: Ig-like domain-containing protein [bacterium]
MNKKIVVTFIISALFCLSIFAAADELLLPGKFSGTITYSGTSTGSAYILIFTESTFDEQTTILPLPAFGAYTVINLIPGTYYMAVLLDCNGNHDLDLGHEPLGAYGGFYQPTPIVVTSGGNTQNINVTLSNPPTGDTISPIVVSISPVNGATNVPTTTRTFSFTFSEAMWIDIGEGTNRITDYGESFSHSWSSDGKTLTYTSDVDLPSNTTLVWMINNNPQGMRDMAGNPCIPKSGAFSTGANLNVGGFKGTISYSGSSTGNIGIYVSSDPFLNELVAFSLISSLGQYNISNLIPGTYYAAAAMDINKSNIPDLGHEPMGVYGSSLYQLTPITVTAHATTANINITLTNPVAGDTTPPILVSSNPANGAYNVSTVIRVVSFTFNEPMWINPSIRWDGIDSNNVIYSWSTDGRILLCTFPNQWYQNISITWTLNPDDENYQMTDMSGNTLPTTTGNFTTQSIGNIPDIKLNIARTETDVFQLTSYLLAGGSPTWVWDSHTTFANIYIDNSNYGMTDYLTPLQWTAGLDTVTFVAPGYGNDESILRYSSYVFNGRLPSALVDNGKKVSNCSIPLSNYFVNLGASPLGPALYSVETVRYSNSADTGKLSVSFSGDTVRIGANKTLLGTADIVVKVYTTTANDWEKEIIKVFEIANTYNQFSTGSDTTQWYYQVYADGTGPGAISWQSTFSDATGILRINQKPGEKGKISQIFNVPAPGWYTAEARVATDISNPAKQQKSYLYLQQFSQSSVITACANQVIASSAGGFGNANTWKTMKISYYATGTILGVQVVAINPSNSGVTSNMYIDNIYVYPASPEVGRAYGASNVVINNGSFFNGDTSNWLIQVYADGSGTGTWDVINAIDPDNYDDHWQVLRGIQSGGQKAKVSQVEDLHYFVSGSDRNAAPSAWVYSGATTQSQTQKVYLYLYSYNTSYSTVIESGNAILYAGQWTPGQWTHLQFGYTPMTLYNAIQVVGINPSSNPSQAIYFDDIALNVDKDTYLYWDHSLF